MSSLLLFIGEKKGSTGTATTKFPETGDWGEIRYGCKQVYKSHAPGRLAALSS